MDYKDLFSVTSSMSAEQVRAGVTEKVLRQNAARPRRTMLRMAAAVTAFAVAFSVGGYGLHKGWFSNEDAYGGETLIDVDTDTSVDIDCETVTPDIDPSRPDKRIDKIDFGVMAFNSVEYTAEPQTATTWGSYPDRTGWEAIRIAGFQYQNPTNRVCEVDPDAKYATIISQNGEFWENISKIKAYFYLDSPNEKPKPDQLQLFAQSGGLIGYSGWDHGKNWGGNHIVQFDEYGNYEFGNEHVFSAVWDIDDFARECGNGVSDYNPDGEYMFDKKAYDVNFDLEVATRFVGGGITQFGFMLQNPSDDDEMVVSVNWTSVTIHVKDMELYEKHVAQVTDALGYTPNGLGDVLVYTPDTSEQPDTPEHGLSEYLKSRQNAVHKGSFIAENDGWVYSTEWSYTDEWHNLVKRRVGTIGVALDCEELTYDLLESNVHTAYNFVIPGDGWVYYQRYNSPPDVPEGAPLNNASICRVNEADSRVEVLVEETSGGDFLIHKGRIYFSKTYDYIVKPDPIYTWRSSIKTDGSDEKELYLVFTKANSSALTPGPKDYGLSAAFDAYDAYDVIGDWVYFLNKSNDTLARVKLDGTSPDLDTVTVFNMGDFYDKYYLWYKASTFILKRHSEPDYRKLFERENVLIRAPFYSNEVWLALYGSDTAVKIGKIPTKFYGGKLENTIVTDVCIIGNRVYLRTDSTYKYDDIEASPTMSSVSSVDLTWMFDIRDGEVAETINLDFKLII
ncbi:MAG: hypothetical protein FWG45_07295 [Oscillospiraceae bacterium]|nr:hypothetical protein [Oscillospiraceae bacterium]